MTSSDELPIYVQGLPKFADRHIRSLVQERSDFVTLTRKRHHSARCSLDECRDKLLRGALFHCTRGHGDRICIDLLIKLPVYLPTDADPKDTFVKCHSVPDGGWHHSYYAADAVGDQIRGLALKLATGPKEPDRSRLYRLVYRG